MALQSCPATSRYHIDRCISYFALVDLPQQLDICIQLETRFCLGAAVHPPGDLLKILHQKNRKT